MFNILRKKEEKSNYKELQEDDIINFSDKFIKINNIDYSESQYLFHTDSNLFNKYNYNSGADLLLRNYLNLIFLSSKLGPHYSFCKTDIFSLSVSINYFDKRFVSLIYISIYDSNIKDTKNYIFDIEFYENSRKIDKLYCNNQICTLMDYLFLLNFIQKNGLYTSPFFGKIKLGYKIDLDFTKYDYSKTL